MFDAIAHNSNYFTATQAQENAERSAAVGADELKDAKHEEATQKARALSEQEKTHPDGRKKDTVELSREAVEIRELQARDQEVRAHEAAHAAAGGSFAGSPNYTFERGPDGQTYAVGGEVSIDVSAVSGDPEATLQKAQQVRAAALAPANPSGQDMKVAQRAQSMAASARTELAEQQNLKPIESADQLAEPSGVEAENSPSDAAEVMAAASTSSSSPAFSVSAAHLSYYA